MVNPVILSTYLHYLGASDESEPSWLEPELELNNFQLDSARLVTFSIQLGIFPIKARKLALLTNFYFDWIMVKNHTFQIQKCILCYIKSNNWPWIAYTYNKTTK